MALSLDFLDHLWHCLCQITITLHNAFVSTIKDQRPFNSYGEGVGIVVKTTQGPLSLPSKYPGQECKRFRKLYILSEWKKPAAALKIHVYHLENILPPIKIIWSLPIYQWFASNVKSTLLNLKSTRPDFL